MLSKATAPALLSFLLLIPGCCLQNRDPFVKYQKSSPLTLTHATLRGDYALFTTTSPTPKLIRHLNPGDRLGFRRDDNGHIQAIAGDSITTLTPQTQTATWKYYGQ